MKSLDQSLKLVLQNNVLCWIGYFYMILILVIQYNFRGLISSNIVEQEKSYDIYIEWTIVV